VDAPPKDEALRRRLEDEARREGSAALHARLARVDPEAASRLPPGDLVRIVRALEVWELSGKPLSQHHREHRRNPRYRALVLGVTPPREELYRRVNERAVRMFEEGLLEETRALAGLPGARRQLERCIGYGEALEVLEGRATREEALARMQQEQRRYAKRQLTWFRKMDVRWLAWPPNVEEAAEAIVQARDFPRTTEPRTP
jgi:tRNA dimethylallyltransferase